jgi:hypothetical protein
MGRYPLRVELPHFVAEDVAEHEQPSADDLELGGIGAELDPECGAVEQKRRRIAGSYFPGSASNSRLCCAVAK